MDIKITAEPIAWAPITHVSVVFTETGTAIRAEWGGRVSFFEIGPGMSPAEAMAAHVSQAEKDIVAREKHLARLLEIQALVPFTPAPSLDLHARGIYVVLDPSGAPILETCAETGYSARATFLRQANKRWSVSEAEGYRVAELKVSSQT